MTPKELAQKIYEDFGFNDPLEIDLNLVANNFHLIIEPIDLEDIDGFIITTKYGGIIKVNKNIKDEGWLRFTIAHELGHFIYRKHKNLLENNPIVVYRDRKNNIEEKFVNAFAAELLMPEEVYKEFVENKSPTIQTFQEISKRFNVSVPAAAVRYTAIGEEPIAVIFSKNGIIHWGVISKKFPLKFIRLYRNVPEKSCVSYLIKTSGNYAITKISAETWFYEDFNLIKNKNVVLFEECLRLSDGDTFLSVIRLESD